MPATNQLSLFTAAPFHPDALPLVTHIQPTYPGEIDYLWPLCRHRHKGHYADLRVMPHWGCGAV